MNIVFDNIIFSLQRSGGISTVWKEFLIRCFKHTKQMHITCINYPNNNIYSNLDFNASNQVLYKKLKTPFSRYSPITIKNDSPFIFHSSYYRICNNPHAINITTVHDFTYELFNHGIKRIIHSWQKRNAILHSSYIICISENTKKDLRRFFPNIDPQRIFVVYNGVSTDYHVLTSTEQENVSLPYKSHEYVLFVGSRAKYKNFELTLQAISRSELNLVVVGAHLNEEEKKIIKRYFKNTSRVFCTGHINNAKLNVLYNYALALIYPSIYEGFGIPILEAQKAGCPVIAYNGSSIPEVIGDTPLLMKETTTNEIIRCLSILSDNERRKQIIENGLKNAGRFSWEKMYNEIMNIYKIAWESRK